MSDTAQTDLSVGIVVGEDRIITEDEIKNFDPQHQFIVRAGELALVGPDADTLDVARGVLGDNWEEFSVQLVGTTRKAWILRDRTAPDGGSHTSVIGRLDDARLRVEAALEQAEMSDSYVDLHYVLGLTPGYGLIQDEPPVPAGREEFASQRTSANDRILAAANGNDVPWPPAPSGTTAAAVIDTGFLPAIGFDPALLDDVFDGGIDVDPDDWAHHEVRPGGLLVGPHMGHGTMVTSVLRTVAPKNRARIYVERAVEGDGANLAQQQQPQQQAPLDEAERVRQAGLVTEETVARQILDAAAENCGVAVINLSLGAYGVGDRPPVVLREAIRAFLEGAPNQRAVVAAAGNFGSSRKFYPAAYDEVIAVGSLDCDHHDDPSAASRDERSNHGDWVDCYAPGVGIVGRYYKGTRTGRDSRVFDGWAKADGSSFAAPYVSGLLASTTEQWGGVGAKAWLSGVGKPFATDAGVVAYPPEQPPAAAAH